MRASSAPPLGRAERTFLLLFLPVAFGFGGRMALVVFNGPLARLFTRAETSGPTARRRPIR